MEGIAIARQSAMSETPEQLDKVIIVGAGLSGLQAARLLTFAGIPTIVLEARSRVGGETWSIPGKDGLGVSDLGAEWLNGVTQPRVYQLAAQLGLEFTEVKVQGDSILQGFDESLVRHSYSEQAPLPDGEDEVIRHMLDLFAEEYDKIQIDACDRCPHDEITLDEFLRSRGAGRATLATFAVYTRVMLGCEPADLSAASFLIYCKSQGGLMKMRSSKGEGKYLTVKTGTQSICEKLAASLPANTVKLHTAVKSVVQKEYGVEIYSADGKIFRGAKVILAFSTPLYRKISFLPPLPPDTSLLVRSTKLGYYTKVLATYSKPWWRETNLSGASLSFLGPSAATRDTSEDHLSRFRLTGFVAGAPGEQWSKLTAAERKKAALDQFSKLFGSTEANHPIEYIEQQWSSEDWSQGSPCSYTSPGVLTKAGNCLWRPFGHVHFAGTETATRWKGYMEGALESGARGADEVLKRLSHAGPNL